MTRPITRAKKLGGDDGVRHVAVVGNERYVTWMQANASRRNAAANIYYCKEEEVGGAPIIYKQREGATCCLLSFHKIESIFAKFAHISDKKETNMHT